jgi:hypothetical protein
MREHEAWGVMPMSWWWWRRRRRRRRRRSKCES